PVPVPARGPAAAVGLWLAGVHPVLFPCGGCKMGGIGLCQEPLRRRGRHAMKYARTRAALLLAAVLIGSSGCGGTPASTPGTVSSGTSAANTITIKDFAY